MEIKRTANAGVLLKMDGSSVLIDGVCGKFPPYLETPQNIKEELYKNPPDVLLLSHTHPDHFDLAFFESYKKTFRTHLGAEGQAFYEKGNIKITAVKTRHIGKNDGEHYSFLIEGSKTVWFMGDASPNELVKLNNFTTPDVLIIPYAYVITPSALKMTESIGAKLNIILHLPNKEEDNFGLWQEVKKADLDDSFVIPEIDENIVI